MSYLKNTIWNVIEVLDLEFILGMLTAAKMGIDFQWKKQRTPKKFDWFIRNGSSAKLKK